MYQLFKALKFMHSGFNIYNGMSAGIAVGILCLPIVTSLAEDALRAVPRALPRHLQRRPENARVPRRGRVDAGIAARAEAHASPRDVGGILQHEPVAGDRVIGGETYIDDEQGEQQCSDDGQMNVPYLYTTNGSIAAAFCRPRR